MRSRVLAGIAVVASLVGLAASIASLIDYLGPVPTFCAESGCATVRASAWAHPLGIPMPLFGIAFFAAMLVVRRGRLWLALAGGAWAIGLVALQATVIGAWCKLCMIADPSAIVLAIAVALGAPRVAPSWRRALAAVPAIAAAVLGLGLWTRTHALELPPGTPAVVVRAQQPGAVTVVEFVDFECPFCRALAPKLAQALPSDVRVVRKMVPLPMHPHAMPAALAWCCADAQGKGDAMAAALFAADPQQLTTEGCEKIAASVGCDLDRYRRDLPAMVGRVAGDMLQALDAKVRALPTVFIGGERITGAVSASDLLAAVGRATMKR